MGYSVAEKIIKDHLVGGKMVPGKEIAIRIDHTLTQDATGTMAYLQFEALGVEKVKTKRSVSYVDHNTLQTGFENADDHAYLQSVAAKHGLYFSRPGNGICHQVQLERFDIPGDTLLGSDSHTPTAGGLGMLAIGAGGLDVAAAMAGEPFYMAMPKICLVRLAGRLRDWVSAKDVVLEVLRILGVKGGVGKIIEYAGEGIDSLSATDRATITNMGAELGATTSIFPSDQVTRAFMASQGREDEWRELRADPDVEYAEVIEINLDRLEPMIARPHSPDNVCKVAELEGTKVDQVAIGSCTNSSLRDLMVVAGALEGRTVHPSVSLVISPGSKQVFEMVSRNGALSNMIAAGARILESACGPCIGMGQSPKTNAVSIRTFNRNFEGRSGTKSARVYLAGPEVAVAAAITGEITDPRKLRKPVRFEAPEKYITDDRMIIPPSNEPDSVSVVRGPNIQPLPHNEPMPETLAGKVLLKVGDNVTTDHIMPAGAKVLPLRSNIPAMSEYVFTGVDPEFPKRAKSFGGGFVVGGENYGQGSSREHAALAPMYLGVKAVIAKSFARIHRQNLINFGILPLTLTNAEDYELVSQLDDIEIPDAARSIRSGSAEFRVLDKTNAQSIRAITDLSDREREIVLAGGRLKYIKSRV
ncbi:MAG: aconitate hydratase [Armatimonadetes bacterium RBG_16_58_9]|nr:MAG: aconitate hydratase [Armatimonadetes bacterium RBG_16_58_9]